MILKNSVLAFKDLKYSLKIVESQMGIDDYLTFGGFAF